MKHLLVRMSMVGALALGMGALGAAPSSAATPVQSCAHVKGSATFSPGLTNTAHNQTISSTGTQTSCTPSAKTGGHGTLTATLHLANASCSTLVNGGQTVHGTGATKWANGKTSHYSLTLKTGTGSNVTTANITGKVTSGLFSGKAVTGQIKFSVSGSPNCTSKPVKHVTFTNSKPFVIS